MTSILKAFFGLPAAPQIMCQSTPAEVLEAARTMTRCREAVKIAFGERAAADPCVVAEFLKADATYQLALEVRAMREILANGTGALTIGIEKAPA
jgi:hypothetical protein